MQIICDTLGGGPGGTCQYLFTSSHFSEGLFTKNYQIKMIVYCYWLILRRVLHNIREHRKRELRKTAEKWGTRKVSMMPFWVMKLI